MGRDETELDTTPSEEMSTGDTYRQSVEYWEERATKAEAELAQRKEREQEAGNWWERLMRWLLNDPRVVCMEGDKWSVVVPSQYVGRPGVVYCFEVDGKNQSEMNAKWDRNNTFPAIWIYAEGQKKPVAGIGRGDKESVHTVTLPLGRYHIAVGRRHYQEPNVAATLYFSTKDSDQ